VELAPWLSSSRSELLVMLRALSTTHAIASDVYKPLATPTTSLQPGAGQHVGARAWQLPLLPFVMSADPVMALTPDN